MLIRRKTMMSTVMHDINVIQTHTNLVSSRIVRYQPYTASVVCDEGYSIYEITIKMGGVDITSTAYDPTYNMISIASVTDDVEINVVAIMPVMFYKVDGAGTEEIISEENACAPTLSLHYPDGGVEKDTRFTYRKTANGQRLNVNGNAFIANIKGETVSWNQLLENGNFADTNGWSAIGNSASLSVSDNVATITKNYNGMGIGGILYRSIANLNTSHKYYLSCIARTLADTHTLTIGFYNINGTEGGNTLTSTNSTSYTKLSHIASPKSNANVLALRCGISSSAAGVKANVYNCMCIDLTLIYGTGKEPTTSAAFEADYFKWFGKPLTYANYDTGTLKPVKMISIKTVGFNLWDEEWENGLYDTTTGAKTTNANAIRSKNYIDVLPNTNYYIRGNASEKRILFYDKDKAFISSVLVQTTEPFTTPSNCRYMTFYCDVSYGDTYLNDIVLNFSSATVSYKSSWSNIATLNVTQIKGKVVTNGVPSGESVTIFPDGMLRARSVRDEIYSENGKIYAVKRVGRLNLGSVNYQYIYGSFYYGDLGSKPPSATTEIADFKMPLYPTGTQAAAAQGTCYGTADGGFYLKDSARGTDPAAFKTAMNGVYLHYRLNNYVTYEIDSIGDEDE